MSNLKPCPFCGGSNLKVWDNGVECKDCECHWPDLGHCVGEKCRDEAIKMWNRRATPEERDIRNAALEEAATYIEQRNGSIPDRQEIARDIRDLKADGESR